MIKTKAIFIIYTKDQKAASSFYTELLELKPTLDVPGMTEFQLSEEIKLGIMPAAGIKRILDDKIDEPNCALTNVKCELYLYVDQPEAYYNKAIALGGIGISHLQNRNWGDRVAYCIDLDGNLLGFAKQIAMTENILNHIGIDSDEDVSKLFSNELYPENYNPINSFEEQVKTRKVFIELLKKKELLEDDISKYNVVELGGGVGCTGAAFAEQCEGVASFELEKVHCLYAKRCKEHFKINNLAVLHGSITKVDENSVYTLNGGSVDLVISHLGLFKYTMIETLEEISKMLKQNGKFICVYPRFWTNDDDLNEADQKLLVRAQEKDIEWSHFGKSLEAELERLGFEIEYKDLLEEYTQAPIGGDVIIGSKIALSKSEYSSHPIDGIEFGKTLISCNTLVCSRK